jgi:signal peptidase I
LQPARPTRRPSFWRELPILLVVAFALAFLVKAVVAQPFYIPSGSMQDTLQVGDRVLVNKVVYHTRDIHRGDVIVFDGTDSFSSEVTVPQSTGAINWVEGLVGLGSPAESDFVKRVIGVGGDHVRCCDVQGRITVNGIALDEGTYLYKGNHPSDIQFDVVVPEGKLWVMGDHRADSADSRDHLGDPGGGFVPVDRVIGRAVAVIWPVSDSQLLNIPDTFNQPGLARDD